MDDRGIFIFNKYMSNGVSFIHAKTFAVKHVHENSGNQI